MTMGSDDSLPNDLASAHALIIAQRQALSAAQARAAVAESEAQYRALLIEKLKFTIKKMRHEHFGQSAERGALLELELAELEEDAGPGRGCGPDRSGSGKRGDRGGGVRTAQAGAPAAARSSAAR